MGFGILFIGYFITYVMSMNPIGVVFRILGYALMCKATAKLFEYDGQFKIAGYMSLSLALLNTFSAVIKLTSFLYDNMVLASNPFSGMIGDIVHDLAHFHGYMVLDQASVHIVGKQHPVF